ncbi:hypothetical protein J132_02371 [Termitomyces sp. J132]|nr:hypothetical protein J132_02371 [Termitomyces sp. J132]
MLDDVRHKLDSITAKINAFPSRGGTFEEAIEIHGSGVLLRVDMGEYTRDLYRFHTFDKAESQDNMKAAKRLERSSEKSLEAIAKMSMQIMMALTDRTYPQLVPEAEALGDRLAKKFTAAIAALKK